MQKFLEISIENINLPTLSGPKYFSTSHVIPHIRALVLCPGLTTEAWVVDSTSVPLTPTEILNLVFL